MSWHATLTHRLDSQETHIFYSLLITLHLVKYLLGHRRLFPPEKCSGYLLTFVLWVFRAISPRKSFLQMPFSPEVPYRLTLSSDEDPNGHYYPCMFDMFGKCPKFIVVKLGIFWVVIGIGDASLVPVTCCHYRKIGSSLPTVATRPRRHKGWNFQFLLGRSRGDLMGFLGYFGV